MRSVIRCRPGNLLVRFIIGMVLMLPGTLAHSDADTTATPQVSGVWGTRTPGAEVRILGANFGVAAPEISSSLGPDGWIESNSPGTELGKVSDAPGWDVGVSSIPPVISSEQAHSGSNSLLGRVVRSDGYWQSVMRYKHGSEFDSIFVSFWVFLDPIAYSSKTPNTQWKWWRLNDYGGVNNDCSEIYMLSRWADDHPVEGQVALFCKKGCNWPTPCDCYASIYDYETNEPICDPCNSRYVNYCSGDRFEDIYPTAREWTKVEIYAESSEMDVANGRLRVTIRKPGKPAKVAIDWAGALTHSSDCCQGESDPWRYFMFQNYWDDDGAGSTTQTADFFYDDIYIQTNTEARVEIGNAGEFDMCTQLELQEVLTWSDTEIKVRLNHGALDPVLPAWLFVVDGEGKPSAGLPVRLEPG